MEGRIFDAFGEIYESGHAANLAAERERMFDICGPEGYCAFDIFEA